MDASVLLFGTVFPVIGSQKHRFQLLQHFAATIKDARAGPRRCVCTHPYVFMSVSFLLFSCFYCSCASHALFLSLINCIHTERQCCSTYSLRCSVGLSTVHSTARSLERKRLRALPHLCPSYCALCLCFCFTSLSLYHLYNSFCCCCHSRVCACIQAVGTAMLLISSALSHDDTTMRCAAGEALGRLTQLATSKFVDETLTQILLQLQQVCCHALCSLSSFLFHLFLSSFPLVILIAQSHSNTTHTLTHVGSKRQSTRVRGTASRSGVCTAMQALCTRGSTSRTLLLCCMRCARTDRQSYRSGRCMGSAS